MYKILLADKDAYITNRIVGNPSLSSSLKVKSNVGSAGSLDLFKLYGASFSSGNLPNLELSRLLIHFDLQPLKDLISEGKININRSSFNCTLKLFDVYGGQTTPSNFNINVYPLSRSFDEGLGRDVVYYSDYDACNFLTSSYSTGEWNITGCFKGGGAEEACDYITASANLPGVSFETSQYFKTGEENLEIDITTAVSATLAGILPDEGYRISFSDSIEQDSYSYFVKRFASRSAYNSSKHPAVIVKFDDSIQDDSQKLNFGDHSTIFARNYSHGSPSNIIDGVNEITGSNCILLRLATKLKSSGSAEYNFYVTGSQHTDGINYTIGLYSASFRLPTTDQKYNQEIKSVGYVTLSPIWTSLDESTTYFTGSEIKAYPPQRSSSMIDFKNYVITTSGLQRIHRTNEKIFVRLNIFDHTAPYVKLTRGPIELPGITIRETYYQVRDITTNEIVIPFDETYKSTIVSSDERGMYFELDASNLKNNRSYVIDALIKLGNNKKVFKEISNVFNISDTQTE